MVPALFGIHRVHSMPHDQGGGGLCAIDRVGPAVGPGFIRRIIPVIFQGVALRRWRATPDEDEHYIYAIVL